MPIDSAAGYSDDTATKQRHFGYVLSVLLRVAQSCMRKDWAYPEFHYFDLNAGPGVVGGIEGSPLIFVRTALEIGLPFRAMFFEEKPENAERLQSALEMICPEAKRPYLRVIVGDHNHTVPWTIERHLSGLPKKWVYGLGYGDGNGRKDAPFGPMAALAERLPQTDLLLNVNATVYKRERGSNQDAGFLLDGLSDITKKHRLIREPVGIHQWTMLLLTNWIGAPDFEQVGFRRLGSEAGREIASRVNFSKPERERGIARPFVQSRLTDPMPSISVTPDSLRSGPSSLHVAAASANAAGSAEQPSRTT